MCNDDAAPSIGADASFFDDLAGLGHFRFHLGSKLLGGITYGFYARVKQLFFHVRLIDDAQDVLIEPIDGGRGRPGRHIPVRTPPH